MRAVERLRKQEGRAEQKITMSGSRAWTARVSFISSDLMILSITAESPWYLSPTLNDKMC